MKSMVYVVLDNGDVLGVYDRYEDAENATIRYATAQATITPVVIGRTDDLRNGCNSLTEVIRAMEKELKESDLEIFPEEEEEEEEEEDNDDVVYSLTPKGKFVMQYVDDGHTFDEAYRIANILFDEEDGE